MRKHEGHQQPKRVAMLSRCCAIMIQMRPILRGVKSSQKSVISGAACILKESANIALYFIRNIVRRQLTQFLPMFDLDCFRLHRPAQCVELLPCCPFSPCSGNETSTQKKRSVSAGVHLAM